MTSASQSVLTPEFAKFLVRLTTLSTGSPLYDDDLVQEALLRGLQAFRKTPDVRYPRAFFSKIVRDTVRDHWRRRLLWVPLESIPGAKFCQTAGLEQELDRNRVLSNIRDALNLLPSEQRELLILHYFEEVPIRDLSVTTGKSRSALKMALLRSRARIMRALTT